MYKLKLQLTAPFDKSYKLAVVGSIPELGNFQKFKVFMKFNSNSEWILEEPIQTKETYFTYKYVVIHDDGTPQYEVGLSRIADLEAIPEMKEEHSKFQEQQQQKIVSAIRKSTTIQKHDEKLQSGFQTVKNGKIVSLYDEWETYTIKFSVLEPFDDPKIDVRLQGNNPYLHDQVMTRAEKPKEWLMSKYGQKVSPFELSVKMRQFPEPGEAQIEDGISMDFFDPDAESRRLEQQPNKFEYYYSLKKFGAKDIVYEREPHRLIEIQDPLLYRGQLGAAKRTRQDSNKVFIVNGVIEKQDGNLNGGFFFNKVKDAKIIIGTYPMTLNDVLRIKKAGATAVLNLQTGQDMANRGVDWHVIKKSYAEAGINRTMSFPIDDSNQDDLVDSLFNCA